jgi:endonuclease VIII
MAEGDTVLRAARRIDRALGGVEIEVSAPSPRGRATQVERLDGRRLERAEARGKNLLLHFGGLVLHSHLGMNGSWQVHQRGAPWRKPVSSAWVILSGDGAEAAQFGGPTLRVLAAAAVRRDPWLAGLGPDVLAQELDLETAVRSLRRDPQRELGDALLDQRLLAGIGNIFKSEACFAARLDPWRRVEELSDEELERVVLAAREAMQEAVAHGRHSRAVYRRAGHPCPTCGSAIVAHGQGDANRTTYWCPTCQSRPPPGSA